MGDERMVKWSLWSDLHGAMSDLALRLKYLSNTVTEEEAITVMDIAMNVLDASMEKIEGIYEKAKA